MLNMVRIVRSREDASFPIKLFHWGLLWFAEDADAMVHEGERASREFRTWWSWAEEAIRGHSREEESRRTTAKKRRRHDTLAAGSVRMVFSFLPSLLHLHIVKTKCPVYLFR